MADIQAKAHGGRHPISNCRRPDLASYRGSPLDTTIHCSDGLPVLVAAGYPSPEHGVASSLPDSHRCRQKPCTPEGAKLPRDFAPECLGDCALDALTSALSTVPSGRLPTRRSWLPRVNGCVVLRGPSHLHAALGPHAKLLLQNAKNRLPPQSRDLDPVNLQTKKALASLKYLDSTEVDHFLSLLCNFQRTQAHDPNLPPLSTLRRLKYQRFPNLVFTVLDKNPGTFVVLCKRLWGLSLQDAFQNQTQFRRVMRCPDHELANKYAMRELLDKADKYGFSSFFQTSKSKAAPSAYLLLKNKSSEETGSLKWRLILSFRHHPLRKLGGLMGRCLSLLITKAEGLHLGYEMTDVRKIAHFVRLANASLRDKAKALNVSLDTLPLKLFELDFINMFPEMSKADVFHACQKLYDVVLSKSRVRACVGMWFSISKYGRKLDKFGKCSTQSYHVFHWHQVKQYLEFELFHNNLLVQGPFILRQHKGVPIGGTCSAQLASAYCLWCEYNLPPDATQDQICQPVCF